MGLVVKIMALLWTGRDRAITWKNPDLNYFQMEKMKGIEMVRNCRSSM
jgi:hypothetical protein